MHEALDQFGALLGPLLVACLLAVTGSYRPALLALAVPGVAVLAPAGVAAGPGPAPRRLRDHPAAGPHDRPGREFGRLPRAFWRIFAAAYGARP